MDTDFDGVARPYDFISRLVFGDALVRAQVSLLSQILPDSSILIVGGGTGWILEEITKIHESGLEIIYVESSPKMIELSKKRSCKNNTVNFITARIEDYQTEKLFDIIITPFFFDLFKKDKIKFLFSGLNEKLRKDGLWFYTDFIPSKYQTKIWQKLLLKTMYLFFGILSKVEAFELVNMDFYFAEKYREVSKGWFYGKFIRSISYRKIML
ncbi:class I SAM-dependent methyltransferase [Dyadobacter subterraneus]|uniref:Class I SAM-dependent methyltransferase n=1 Tax=Dyadobacter subterraneus TaxID=2773304 RepID=A0ABR9W5W3_9BACT|nr:class I SAM-dependent methyltransferase [Dyadobacter subterraneus]MBE9460838.1 class I SAM-dependent methyltransferase [Dyadobacter subterraneus]